MLNYQTIRFGLGEVICDKAVVGDLPAVTLEPAIDAPGIVGHPGPDEPADKLRNNSVVLEFHGDSGARILIEDIALSLFAKGANISMFLRELACKLDTGSADC